MGDQDCVDEWQREALRAAEADGWKILPGQQYRYVRGIGEDGPFTWRERPEMGKLCRAHDLFDE
jgi:hypothetical protein